MEIVRDKSASGISDAAIRRWINVLTAIDRKLAQIAITEAAANDDHHRENSHHDHHGKIAEALEELARGDAAASHGDYDTAIGRYGLAWKKAKDCDGDND
jgi:hypothetical protein